MRVRHGVRDALQKMREPFLRMQSRSLYSVCSGANTFIPLRAFTREDRTPRVHPWRIGPSVSVELEDSRFRGTLPTLEHEAGLQSTVCATTGRNLT